MLADICLINMEHESVKHKSYKPFPNGLLDKSGQYTKEARKKYNEMIVHFVQVLEETIIKP